MSRIISFLRKHGKASKTTLTVEPGVSLRLSGLPAAYTVGSVKALALAQAGDVKGSVRSVLETGQRVSSTFALDADRAAQLVAGEVEDERKPRGGKRQTAMANGEPVAASSNGSAS
jgi:hypothetical protein